jgi:hypothetical protein
MNNFNKLSGVAEAAYKIMNEKLHPNQQKLDVHEPEKDELSAKDFEMLRNKKKMKEEAECKCEEKHEGACKMEEDVEQIDELSNKTMGNYYQAAKQDNADHADSRRSGDKEEAKYAKDRYIKRSTGMAAAKQRMNKEDVDQAAEQILEYKTDKDGRYVHKGTYGTAKGAEYGDTDYDKENDMAKSLDKKKPKKKAYGARQNFVRSTRVNETFTGLMSVYTESGLKALAEAWGKKKKVMSEEPTNDKYKKELDAQQKKSETKVEEETVDIELVIDGQNGYDQVQIGERALTDDETAKKEEIVKSMKKGLAGFKERYGKDAKSVMYATATKQAKGD